MCTCLPIIVTEVTWDAIFGTPGEGELGRNILADFFRAALLVAAVVWAVIYMVKTMKKVLRTARESAMEEASPAEKTPAAE